MFLAIPWHSRFQTLIIQNLKTEAELTVCPTNPDYWLSFTQNVVTMSESSAPERQHVMKKASIKTVKQTAKQDIPELKREQLGVGVRGKYHAQFVQGSNVVVLQPEILKAFPTSEAVNKALANMLAFAKETQGLSSRSSNASRKRVSA